MKEIYHVKATKKKALRKIPHTSLSLSKCICLPRLHVVDIFHSQNVGGTTREWEATEFRELRSLRRGVGGANSLCQCRHRSIARASRG